MRIFTTLCLSVMMLTFTKSFSQKIISEGTLVYEISIESVNGEKQLAASLNGALLTLNFDKERSSSEMISSLGKEANVFDSKKNTGFILKEYSGQKLMITTTAENWAQKNAVNRRLDFTVDAATVDMLGYKCKKASATSADGKKYIVYFDPSLIIGNKTYNNAFPQIAGLPVRYQLSSGNLVFTYSLKSISLNAVSEGKFDEPKAGFRVMTYDENQQLKREDKN